MFFISMMTKLLQLPKIPKGPIHPLLKRRARISQPLRAWFRSLPALSENSRRQLRALMSQMSAWSVLDSERSHMWSRWRQLVVKSPSSTVQESSRRCTRQLKMFQFRPRLNNMKLRFVQDSFKKLWNFMIQRLHLVVGFVVGMRTHVPSLARSADLSAAPKHLGRLVVFRPLPRLRRRPASVGLLIQEVSPISCLRVCLGTLVPRTAVQLSIRFP